MGKDIEKITKKRITKDQSYLMSRVKEAAKQIEKYGIKVGDIIKWEGHAEDNYKDRTMLVYTIDWTDDELGVMVFADGLLMDGQGKILLTYHYDKNYADDTRCGNVPIQVYLDEYSGIKVIGNAKAGLIKNNKEVM